MKKLIVFGSMLAGLPALAQTGNVGIGTTTPAQKLDVIGAISATRIAIGNTAPLADVDVRGDTLGLRNTSAWDNLWFTVDGATANIHASGAENGLNLKVGANNSGAYGNGQGLTNVMTLLPSGNTGIGATNPGELLQIGSSSGAAYASPGILLQSSANTNGQGGILKFRETGGGYGINLRHNTEPAGTNVEGLYVEGVNNGTASNIMTFDQNGLNVGVRTLKPLATLDVQGTLSVGEIAYPGGLAFSLRQDGAGYVGRVCNFANGGSASNGLRIDAGVNNVPNGGFSGLYPAMLGFYRPDGTLIGAVGQGSSNSVFYATTSDTRLKQHVRPTHYTLDDLLRIQVRDYNYTGDGSPQTGFLAQQLYTVFPEAVSRGGEEAKTQPWMVDYSRLTPLIIKAMQDMNEKVERLEQENAVLRAQDNRLEELTRQVAALQEALGALTKDARQ